MEEGTLSPNHTVEVGGREFEGKLGKEKGHEWTREDVKVFSEVLGMRLGAKGWKKHGWEISYAIPCSIIGGPSGPDDVSHLP